MTNVLVLYNKPLLPRSHPDSVSEYSVIGVAKHVADLLGGRGYAVSMLALGRDPFVLCKELGRRNVDVIFNLFEGNYDDGETEAHLAGLLQWKGIPFTGSPLQALSLCRNKPLTKHLLRGAGVPTANFLSVAELPMPECTLEFPVIVKPACLDASVGMDQDSVCTDSFQLENRVRFILDQFGGPVLVEEYIRGREFNIALLELPELNCLPPAEITFPQERPGYWPILTYDGKWKPGTEEYDSTPPKYPADISPSLAQRLCKIASSAYRLLGCRDYARVDVRVRNGRPYVLEVNPNPEISDEAGFAGCLGSAGISYTDFLCLCVETAFARRNRIVPPFALNDQHDSVPANVS